ncbi:hypothetical protein FACS1894198_5070 [Clostridia bacterium]|nr:hypothetical protein FACS1894198_5070 [Clostridia bacterium]
MKAQELREQTIEQLNGKLSEFKIELFNMQLIHIQQHLPIKALPALSSRFS